jgi:hypothetical protein
LGTTKKFDSLSTSYVSLSGLIRQLREQNFAGLIHVVLDQYEAEVLLNEQGAATVSEIDIATRQVTQKEGAMERLLVHAREPGGSITVYENASATTDPDDVVTPNSAFASSFPAPTAPAPQGPATDVSWEDLLEAGGKLIRAVERAVGHLGADFESTFRSARIELGDDYPFLDPTSNRLTYADGVLTLGDQPAGNVFATGLSESLRRMVNKVATGKDGKRFRESVAIELAVATRVHRKGMSAFMLQLDRIAGTRVL